MTDRLKCPGCGMPTIEDRAEDITREEMLCEACFAREDRRNKRYANKLARSKSARWAAK